ncbi:MAG TPA: hypothetical protein VGS97_21945 [Actinocrinis sp.]|uniref:hypothetical protein n=1 Tax=Actinocrinis sp. TaxID=1920516 RepID=UPI002DDD3BD3|nr:hypothetical protein [Actinocrinis sp.]HEV2346780.1 hypothetical protein [Actinocrinis sp.]
MASYWRLQGSDSTCSGQVATELIRRRLASGTCETWFHDDAGRSLAVLTNGARTLLIFMISEGDPGEHAVDLGAEGRSGGCILLNGQHDHYANRDTVLFDQACDVVRCIIDLDEWPEHVSREVDR